MKKVFIASLFTVALIGSVGLSAMAQTLSPYPGNGGGTGVTGTRVNPPTVTGIKVTPGGTMTLKGLQSLTPADSQCLITAIDTRDTLLAGALQTFDAAMISNYRTRNTALKAALVLTDTGARAAGVSAASVAFRIGTMRARVEWQKSRQTAWEGFAADRKACGASIDTSFATGRMTDDVNQ